MSIEGPVVLAASFLLAAAIDLGTAYPDDPPRSTLINGFIGLAAAVFAIGMSVAGLG